MADGDWRNLYQGVGVGGSQASGLLNYIPSVWAAKQVPGLFSHTENPNDQQTRGMLMDFYRNAQNQGPVQMGPQAMGQTSQDMRNRQLSLADQLQAISTGKGPSVAEQQLRSATDRNVAQQSSFANSGRGGAMAGMRAANNSARLGAQASQDAGVMRAQEANQARQLLGLNLHGMRDADEGMSRFNAEQGNQMSQAQMWANLKSRGMQNDSLLAAISGLQGQNNALYNRPTTGERLLSGGAGLASFAASNGML